MENKRILYLDMIRILAVFSVIALHIAASNLSYPPESFQFLICNIYNSLTRFCVPILVMISGFLFLNPEKEISIEKLFKKNILRIVTAYIFWSACYSIYESNILYLGINSDTIKAFTEHFLLGHYHLWFPFMIVGLYLIVPFLRKITVDKKLVEYFLLLAFIFGPLISALKLAFDVPTLFKMVDKFQLRLVLGYVIYFVGGYYFGFYDISKTKKRIIYLLGIVSIIFTVAISRQISISEGTPYVKLTSWLLPNTVFLTLSVFLFFKDVVSKIKFNDRMKKIIIAVSNCSFGIYLVHDMVNIIFAKIGFWASNFNVIISIPLIASINFICSFIIIYFISKIQVLKKYII